MPDQPGTGNNLLLSMGLDLSPVIAAANTIKTILDNLDALASQVAVTAMSAAKQQSSQMGALKTQAQEDVAAAKAAIVAENAKTDIIKSQTAEITKQHVEQRASTEASQAGVTAHRDKLAAAKAETAETKAQTAELQRQTAELRKQALEMRLERQQARETEGAEEGGFRPFGRATGLFQRIGAGVMGKGLAGTITGGILAGEGITAAVEGAGEAIERFIDKLKAVSIEEGSIVELDKVFRGLAAGVGVNATQAMDRLNEASEGLVNKITLLRVATMALRSPYKITMDQTNELAHDVTVLAEASGHTAEEGMQGLYSSLARGRPYMLGAVTGVAALRDVMRDIPTSLGPVQRGMYEWQRAMELIHKQALAIGDLPDTFEKMSSRIKIASHNAMLSFGIGFNEAFAGRTVGGDIAQTTRMFRDMQESAQKLGQTIGQAMAVIAHAILRADDVMHRFAGTLKLVAELAASWGAVELIGQMSKFVASTLAGVSAVTRLREALMLLQMSQIAMKATKGAEGVAGIAAGAEKIEASGAAAAAALPKVKSLGEALRLLKANPALAAQISAAGVAAEGAAPKVSMLGGAFAFLRTAMGGIITVLATAAVYLTAHFVVKWKEGLTGIQGMTVTWGDVMLGVWHRLRDGIEGVVDAQKGYMAQTQSWTEYVLGAQAGRAAANPEQAVKEIQRAADAKYEALQSATSQSLDAIKTEYDARRAADKTLFQERKISHEQLHQRTLENNKEEAAQRKKVMAESHAQELQNINAEFDSRLKVLAAGKTAEVRQQIESYAAIAGGMADVQQQFGKQLGLKIKGLPKTPAQFGTLSPDLLKQIEDLEKERSLALQRGSADKFEIHTPIDTGIPDQSIQEMNRRAQTRMQAQMALAKAELQGKKDQINEEKELDSEAYEYQNESATQHYANLRKIAKESYDASRKEAAENFVAQAAMYKERYQSGEDSYVDFRNNMAKLQQDYNNAMNNADSTFHIANLKVDDEAYRDRQQAYLKYVESRAQLQESELHRQELTTKDIRFGGATPDDYLQSQVKTITAIADVQIDKANRIYAATKQNQDALQIRADAINKAIEDARSKLDDLQQTAPQVRLQAIQWAFQPQQQSIQAQMAALRPEQNPAKLQQAMLDNLQKQREALEAAIKTATPYSDIWNQIFSQIEKTYEMQQKYNDELRKSKDMLQPISDSLSSITKLVGSVWTSHFVQGLTAGMQGGLAAVKGAVDAGARIRNAFTHGSQEVQKDPQMVALERAADSAANSFANIKTGTGSAVIALGEFTGAVQNARDWLGRLTTSGPAGAMPALGGIGTQSAGEAQTQTDESGAPQLPTQPTQVMGNLPTSKMPGQGGMTALQQFSAGLVAAVGELSNFAQALTKSNSALGGLMSGGVGGAGMGQSIATALGSTGPWGMLAGAGVGMLLGGITGAKNANMSSELSQLNAQYTSIMDTFHSNTNNLEEAIQQMQELIVEAQVDMANSKKGGSQFASLISQYSQQLMQLEDQQHSIISSMEIQLGIFSTPTGMQQFLTNLNQIIDTYDKFAGAASNAMQLAQANSWLTDSLSSYTQQMSNTFVSDEESGIQDALQLNTLLSERSTLISNINDSIINVLEQGVLTRQQTLAQSKGQKIWEIESQHSLALSSINQEISLQEYKVAIETSLFNLAMTSMGLEAQLLALQEGQASQSLAAISALQELIQMLQGGNYNFSTISSILSQLGFGAAAGNIPPSGLMPGGGTASTNAADAMIAAAYQSRATLGYGAFRGVNL